MTRWKARWLAGMIGGSMLTWSGGCATKVVIVPADREVIRIQAGEAYTPRFNGWFVPDARMREMLLQLRRTEE
jgi:hypothetical protein